MKVQEETLYFFRKTKGVETVVYSDGKAFVRYSSKTEAVEAVKKLGKTKVKGEDGQKLRSLFCISFPAQVALNGFHSHFAGQPVAVMRQSQEMILMSPKYLQRCKLIVRNLAFQVRDLAYSYHTGHDFKCDEHEFVARKCVT